MSLAEGILDLLFPPKCPFCQKMLEHPRAPLCPACQPELAWLEGAAGERRVDFTCGCFSPLGYRGRTAQAVKRYKFQRVRAYAEPLGELMAQCLQDRLPQGADLVTWAPLSQKRLRERGFNQAELLARRVGELCGLPCAPTLRKIRHTRPQSGLAGDGERQANAEGAYELLPGAALSGKRVVLVDDVVTSGATLSQCARLLREAGAEAVYGLTLAQARGDEDRSAPKLPEKTGKL